MISVTVKDFGPIIEGTVELKPLTVFIGPNNSGKSYMATLVYALLLQVNTTRDLYSIPHEGAIGRSSPVFYDWLKRTQTDDIEDELIDEVDAWIAKRLAEGLDFSNIPVTDLPEKLIQPMQNVSEVALFGTVHLSSQH